MASQTKQESALNVVLGALTIGEEGKEGARVHKLEDIEAILDIFHAHGHNQMDTAKLYAEGTSEEYLGKVGYQKHGINMATKLYPTHMLDPRGFAMGLPKVSHSPEDLRKHLDLSLKALQTDCLDLWYLNGPDRITPYEVTLKAVNDLYKEGKFKRFGLSNFMSWEVAEIVGICKANGYIQPTVYQGMYNILQRNVEPELFPCLRKFGIAFYGYNSLGGGFYTGRYHSLHDEVEPGSRFDPTRLQGQIFRTIFWKEPYFNALGKIEAVAQKHNLTMAETALRWTSHHSLMKREFGDSVVIGVSRTEHIEQNLIDLEKGPLPEEVVKVLDEAWLSVIPFARKYYH